MVNSRLILAITRVVRYDNLSSAASVAHSKVLLLIPARFASTRFPGKPLEKIGQKSIIQRVYENCQSIEGLSNIECNPWVVTDDSRIEKEVRSFSGNVLRVDDEVMTGSERVYLAFKRHLEEKGPWSLVVNVQGDEPLLKGTELKRVISFHLESEFDIVTMVKKIEKDSDCSIEDVNKVKAIYSPYNGRCLYFSRAPVPSSTKDELPHWYLHIGVYSYRPQALHKFSTWPPSYYEKHERLEQLRALENGLSIGAVETNKQMFGIDTPEDLKKLEGVLSGKSN